MLTITICYLTLEIFSIFFSLIVLKTTDEKKDIPFYIMLFVAFLAILSRWYPEYNLDNGFIYLSYILLPVYILLRIKTINNSKR